jgi:competence protein ComEC
MNTTPSLRLFVLAAIGILAGHALQPDAKPMLIVSASLVMLMLIAELVALRTSNQAAEALRNIFSFLAVIAAFATATPVSENYLPKNNLMQYATGENVSVLGRAIAPPALKPQAKGGVTVQLTLDAAKLVRDTDTLIVTGKHRLRLSIRKENAIAAKEKFSRLQSGDRVWAYGKLDLPPLPANKGEFNYREYLASQGIFVLLQSNGLQSLRPTGETDFSWFERFIIQPVYRYLARTIETMIPKGDEQNFVKGLLLGDRSGISDEVSLAFRKTGTTHVLSISGLHVVLIAQIIFILTKRLTVFKFGNVVQFILAASLLVIYSFVTGNSPSVVRAVVMSLVVMFGRVVERRQNIWNSLGFAGLVIVAYDPKQLFDVSFQLSFLAVASLVYFYPKVKATVQFKNRSLKNDVLSGLWSSVSITIAASLGTAPFVSYYFGGLSVMGGLANLAIVPLTNFSIMAVVASVALNAVSVTLAGWMGMTAFVLTKAAIGVAKFFSELPFAFQDVRVDALSGLAFYAVVLLVTNLADKKRRASWAIWALLMLNITVWKNIQAAEIQVPKIIFMQTEYPRPVLIGTLAETAVVDKTPSNALRVQTQLDVFNLAKPDTVLARFATPPLVMRQTLRTQKFYRFGNNVLKVRLKTHSILFVESVSVLKPHPFFKSDVLVLTINAFSKRERQRLETFLAYHPSVQVVYAYARGTRSITRKKFEAFKPRNFLAATESELVLSLDANGKFVTEQPE